VLGRSWEDLALDSAPRLADVLFWIFVIAPAVASVEKFVLEAECVHGQSNGKDMFTEK
jgi:hypothetical protein